jgi:uncharacterized membrane protein YoaK (UPF0700 family)
VSRAFGVGIELNLPILPWSVGFMRSFGPSPSPERPTPTDLGLALLALASGASDAVAFLTLGKVFTSAMTGNMALLGISLSRGHLSDAFLGLSALTGFVVGVATAAAVSAYRGGATRVLRPLLALEAVYLVCFALVWTVTRHPAEGTTVFGLIVLSSAAMGIQSVVARTIDAPAINTIVFTSTLVSIITSITDAVVRRARPLVGFATLRQIGIFFTYAIGAIVAAVLTKRELAWVAFLPLVSVLGAFACCEFDARREGKKQ